jgi:hypothetical protein
MNLSKVFLTCVVLLSTWPATLAAQLPPPVVEFTAGGGIRTLLGNRITLGADLRVGWETHVRLGAVIGVKLGK